MCPARVGLLVRALESAAKVWKGGKFGIVMSAMDVLDRRRQHPRGRLAGTLLSGLWLLPAALSIESPRGGGQAWAQATASAPVVAATKGPTVAAVQPVPQAGAAGTAAATGEPVADPKKPRKFWIDGKFRELKKGEVRPYYPPKMLPDVEPSPSTVKVFEVSKLEEGDPQVLARPYYGAPMIGTVQVGAKLPVRGETTAKFATRFCKGKRWLAIAPMGWMCADHGKPVEAPADATPIYQIVPGERVPFRYIMVSAKEPLPMWATLNDLKDGAEPERMLERGDSVAVEKQVKHDGQSYWQSVEGKIVPLHGTYQMSATSTWHGILLDEKTPLPFGWALGDPLSAWAEPPASANTPPVTKLKRRTRLDILDEVTVKGKRFLKVRVSAVQTSAFPVATAPLPTPEGNGPATAAAPTTGAAPATGVAARPSPAPAAVPPVPAPAATPGVGAGAAVPPGAVAVSPGAAPAAVEPTYWVNAAWVNEVRLQPRPAGINPVSRWFDADLGEQVLVLYEGEKPIYATLVSSGKNNATPLGNYPVWARVTGITMKSQPYDDKPYFVNMVPWSTFFQAHNAIHGAYWHDRFGMVKSHGCINVSPLDARFVFEVLEPRVPNGWTSFRPIDLRESPTLHVWDSHRRPSFKQDRPIGPPDRQDENERLEEAEKRRAEQLATGVPAGPGPGAAGAAPAPGAAPAATPAPGAVGSAGTR